MAKRKRGKRANLEVTLPWYQALRRRVLLLERGRAATAASIVLLRERLSWLEQKQREHS